MTGYPTGLEASPQALYVNRIDGLACFSRTSTSAAPSTNASRGSRTPVRTHAGR